MTQPTPAPSPPTVAAGRIVPAPAGAGLAFATLVSFTAEGFHASDGGALTFLWDFGDGVRASGGATASHVYRRPGAYEVTATATSPAGTSGTAKLTGLQIVTVSGRWGLVDEDGSLLMPNISLTQDGATVSGDDTRLDCRFTISGNVAAQRTLVLTFVRPPGDCRGRGLPVSLTFAGTADDGVTTFGGVLTTGAAATLIRCSRPGC